MKKISPSQIESADASTPFGCMRKWWFEHGPNPVPRAPQDPSQALGTAIHSSLERFLKGGTQGELHERVIEAPGALEYLLGLRPHVAAIEARFDDGIRLAGVPVTGIIDFTANRPDMPELGDWKTTSAIAKYGKTSGELAKATPMNIYQKFMRNGVYTGPLRMTLGYFQTKGAKKFETVSVECSKQENDSRILEIEALVEEMKVAEDRNTPEEIAPNPKACFVGHGCPHRSYCPSSGDPMASLFAALASTPATPTQSPPPGMQFPGSSPLNPVPIPTGVLPPDAAKPSIPVPPVAAAGIAAAPAAEPIGSAAATGAFPEKKPPGRPKGSQNKLKVPEEAPSFVPAPVTSSGPVTIERLTVRHGARIGLPNFSSATVEVEVSGIVNGDLEAAKESLSLQAKTFMLKELEIYKPKGGA